MNALRIPNFRNFILGAFVSEIGNQMQTVAVAWQVYEITRNPASLGLIGLANFLPILFFSLIGGVAADKIDRKKLLIVSQTAQAIGATTLFVLTYLSLINPPIIYLLLFLQSTASSFSLPARQAVLPNLVPKDIFIKAVSLNNLQFQIATLSGPAIAGLLIAGLGVHTVYLFNAMSFFAFILAVISITVPINTENKGVEFNLSSVTEGIRFVFKTPILYMTMILDFLATFLGEAANLMPIFAKDILHVGPQGLGLLYSAPAVGGILAGVIITNLHKIRSQGKIILGGVIIYGIATIGFGLSTNLSLSLFFLFFVGFGDMMSTIVRNTVRQMVTPDHLRGRMASVMRIFFQGGPQLGEMEAGFLAKAIGGGPTVVIGGIGVVVITSIIALKNHGLRNYEVKEYD